MALQQDETELDSRPVDRERWKDITAASMAGQAYGWLPDLTLIPYLNIIQQKLLRL